MEPVKLLERAASGAASAIRHPITSAAYAAGIVRGLAGVGLRAATRHEHPGIRPRTRSAADPHAVPSQPSHALVDDDIPPPEPTPLHESFATEPKAVSRQSEHGGPASDAEIDAWIDLAMEGADADVETPVGTTGADVGTNPDTAETDLQQPGTEPLVDPSTVKAIKSESDMLRKGAERNPE